MSDGSLLISESSELQQFMRTSSTQESSLVKIIIFYHLQFTYHSASLGVWVGDWEVEVVECQVVRGPHGKGAPAGP